MNIIKNKKKGFTLMELLVSLGIVAALSMMVTPMIMGKVEDAKKKADISNANAIAVAVKSEIINGTPFTNPLTDSQKNNIADEYFDGKLPKPQSMKGTFDISVNGTKVIVSVTEGENITNFYPADDKLLVENN